MKHMKLKKVEQKITTLKVIMISNYVEIKDFCLLREGNKTQCRAIPSQRN